MLKLIIGNFRDQGQPISGGVSYVDLNGKVTQPIESFVIPRCITLLGRYGHHGRPRAAVVVLPLLRGGGSGLHGVEELLLALRVVLVGGDGSGGNLALDLGTKLLNVVAFRFGARSLEGS